MGEQQQKILDSNFSLVPEIRIISDDWGSGNPKDILKVLISVAEILFPLGGNQPYHPVWVGKSEKGPIVLYQRGKKGEYIVNLNSQDRYWCQYAFQFGHEIGHILCGFKDGNSSNLWFEETLCEVASLYTLLHLEKKWAETPPYPHWKEYGAEFTKYAQKRMLKYESEIPKDMENWFQENTEALLMNPVDRPRNVALAVRLLPLFERFPEGWQACAFLNEKKSMETKSFYSYLNDWYESCRNPKQKKFVKRIALKFGFKLSLKKNLNND